MLKTKLKTNCKSCGAEIVFLLTAKGHLMPVESHTVTGEETHYEHGKHISHFANCPSSKKHRKSDRKSKAA